MAAQGHGWVRLTPLVGAEGSRVCDGRTEWTSVDLELGKHLSSVIRVRLRHVDGG